MPSDFIPPSGELQRVAEEISLLRRDFQAAVASLGRMEKRLKASFPAYSPKKPVKKANSGQLQSGKTADQLNSDFDSLLVATKEGGDVGFESAISDFPDTDVIALAHQLGIGSLKTTSTKKAREGVRKRVQESLMLSSTRKKTVEQADEPNPHAFGTSGISPAEQARMPETSGDR